MLTFKRSGDVIPEVNLGELVTCASVNKVAHSGFETQRRRHKKSETGVSVAPQKDLCPSKILKGKSLAVTLYGETFIAVILYLTDTQKTKDKLKTLPSRNYNF